MSNPDLTKNSWYARRLTEPCRHSVRIRHGDLDGSPAKLEPAVKVEGPVVQTETPESVEPTVRPHTLDSLHDCLSIPPWVTTTKERYEFLRSHEHRAIAERYHAKFIEVIRRYWTSRSKAELKEFHRTKLHPKLYSEEFLEDSLNAFIDVTSNYDFKLDQRDWESLDDKTFLAKEIFPHDGSLGNDSTTLDDVPLLSSPEDLDSLWPTGTYIRYSQQIWLSASWNVVPAFTDHMLSLAGYVLTTAGRNFAPLATEERLEVMRLEWQHLASARDRAFFFGGGGGIITDEDGRILSPRPDITPKESVRIKLLLGRCPFAIYLPFIDVDCTDECPKFDKVESPKRAVERAVAAHEIMKRIFGSLKWKLSNKRGGLHGVIHGTLPPEIESTDLLRACAWWIEKECKKAGIPTLSTVAHEKKLREWAEVLDSTPFHKQARGHGGMYRTPGCVKTDQAGREKSNSVAQDDVEKHIDELPWLAPLAAENVGEPFADFKNLPVVLAEFRSEQAKGLEVERKRRHLRPGEIPSRPRMARPKLELGGEALLRTVEAIQEFSLEGRKHWMRVCLAGLLLFRHGIPAQTATATLVAAFPTGQEDAVQCVQRTIELIQGGDDKIAGFGALSKLIGHDGAKKIESAILDDEQERIESNLANPLEDDEIIEAYAVQEEIADQEAAENDRLRQEAANTKAAVAKKAQVAEKGSTEDGASKAPLEKPQDEHLPSLLSVPETFWDPRDKDKKRGYFEHVIKFVIKNTNAPKVDWKKFVWGFAGHAVLSGIARGVVYRTTLKAKLDNGDNHWEANRKKIKNQEVGVGGVWTIRRALGDRLCRHYIEAFAKDLADLEAPEHVRVLALRGSALIENERFILDTVLAPKRQAPLHRRDAAHGLEAILRCETFGAAHDCTAHGKDVCYLTFVCKKDQCRHCRYHREKAKRIVIRRMWPTTNLWYIAKIPLEPKKTISWYEYVEIGDDGLPRKRVGKGKPRRKKGKTKKTRFESSLLRDRVRQSYYLHPLVDKKTKPVDRWPKKIPHKVIMGFDHAIVVAPAEHSDDGVPADTDAIASWMQGWGGDVELVSRDEVIDRIITHQYTIGEAFDKFILSGRGLVDGYGEDDVLSWLAKGTKTVGGNDAGKVHLPWPNATILQEFLMEQADKAREFLKVKVGECPVIMKKKNRESGEEEASPCAMKCRIRHEKINTGETLETNSAGRVMAGRELWKLADKRGMLLVEDLELQKWTYTIRSDARRMAQQKRQLAAASGPPQ